MKPITKQPALRGGFCILILKGVTVDGSEFVAQALLPVPVWNLKEAGTDKSVCATFLSRSTPKLAWSRTRILPPLQCRSNNDV